ncbi:hypothetical protein RCL1_004462 [Eukaryota sp. TZLM3-RCL]
MRSRPVVPLDIADWVNLSSILVRDDVNFAKSLPGLMKQVLEQKLSLHFLGFIKFSLVVTCIHPVCYNKIYDLLTKHLPDITVNNLASDAGDVFKTARFLSHLSQEHCPERADMNLKIHQSVNALDPLLASGLLYHYSLVKRPCINVIRALLDVAQFNTRVASTQWRRVVKRMLVCEYDICEITPLFESLGNVNVWTTRAFLPLVSHPWPCASGQFSFFSSSVDVNFPRVCISLDCKNVKMLRGVYVFSHWLSSFESVVSIELTTISSSGQKTRDVNISELRRKLSCRLKGSDPKWIRDFTTLSRLPSSELFSID